MELIVNLAILFFAMIIHECSHGWMAAKCGDDTAKVAGRLTLNPIPHIDPFGTLLFPAFCLVTRSPVLFGWAKPVPVDPRRFNAPRADAIKVAAAGPVANLGLGVMGALSLLVARWVLELIPFDPAALVTFLHAFVSLNVFLAFFNLIPFPPLDGSQILVQLLPEAWGAWFETMAPYGFLLLTLTMAFGLLYPLLAPAGWITGWLLRSAWR
ncbi:MAG: site-2 protease family protein [Elusimicrobia bacterium]|nr:site-2 protease family protein [Elusimicrobiota bacterium]